MLPQVEMLGISKQFPGVKALDGVDFTLNPGEIHVLFGENGAGKSTLISILSGVYRPTGGEMKIAGEKKQFRSVHEATLAGVGTVFQNFSLIPTLKVFENIYLGKECRRGWFLDRSAMIKGAEKLCTEFGFKINIHASVSKFSRAEQQMVEIAKAFHGNVRVLILDEPTASLTNQETKNLFSFLLRAKKRGVGIIYISHRIHEFKHIADRITVLRDGRLIGTVAAADANDTLLIEMMTGRTVGKIYPKIRAQRDGNVVLSLRDVHSFGVDGVDIDVRAGEVLGLAGLVGCGKSRVWRSVIGLQPVKRGSVMLKGKDVTNVGTVRLLRQGVFYLPPDRKGEGLQLSTSSYHNLSLGIMNRPEVKRSLGYVAVGAQKNLATKIAKDVRLAKPCFTRMVSRLSGGNQQKVLFGKGLGKEQDVYIFDEPTVGVDMGTRQHLYGLIKNLTERNKAVVIISSDLPEVMGLVHRLLVFANGKISTELIDSDITEEKVLQHFFAK